MEKRSSKLEKHESGSTELITPRALNSSLEEWSGVVHLGQRTTPPIGWVCSSGRGISLLLLLGVGGGETVHVHDALLGQTLAHDDWFSVDWWLELGSSNKAGSLELDKAVADALAGGEAGGLSSGSTAGLSSEVLTESLDTELLSHVELVADGSSASVEPVLGVWGELLVASSLNVLGPLSY